MNGESRVANSNEDVNHGKEARHPANEPSNQLANEPSKKDWHDHVKIAEDSQRTG